MPQAGMSARVLADEEALRTQGRAHQLFQVGTEKIWITGASLFLSLCLCFSL